MAAVTLMSDVIDVDAVSDEAAAMRHLEASNPAILVVMETPAAPRNFASYKKVKNGACVAYARSDIDLVQVTPPAQHAPGGGGGAHNGVGGTFEASFFRVGMKTEPRAAREASTDAPVVGLARLPHPGAAHKEAFRAFAEQSARHFRLTFPNSPLVVVGDMRISSEQDVRRLSATQGGNSIGFFSERKMPQKLE